MKIYSTNKINGLLLFLILMSTSFVAQTFCIDKKSDQIIVNQEGYRYELWNQNSQGKACITIEKGAAFSGYWNDVENYLARRGLTYNQTKKHQEIGFFKTNFNCDYNPAKGRKGNSYLSVYGWTIDPLIEYYIVEDWRNWIPSKSKDAILKGTFNANGSTYDVYEKTRIDKPSIKGNTTFKQYFSIRRETRNKGFIDITKHFNTWESLGMQLGKLHEVSFVVEGYKSNGSFNFKELEVLVSKTALNQDK